MSPIASVPIPPSAPRKRAGNLIGWASLAAILGMLAAPGVAGAASLSWSGPIPLTRSGGQQTLKDVACPSTSECTAVDGVGQQVTFNPTSPGTPTPTTLAISGGPAGVACPSTSQCTAVEGVVEVTFDPAAPGTPTPVAIDPSGSLTRVACPLASQCTAINTLQQEVTFDPMTGTVTSGPTAIDSTPSTFLNGLACPSASECVAIDNSGDEVKFDPTAPGTPTATTIDAGANLYGVACPLASQCTAVETSGRQVTFNPTSGALTSGPTAIDGTNTLSALACPSNSQCTAVDYSGNQVTFDPVAPATPTVTPIDGGGPQLNAVACPSTSQCTAVDSVGQVVTFDPTASGTSTTSVIDAVTVLDAVACPTASQCTAVDAVGREVTFDPAAPGAPTPVTIDPGGGGMAGVACPSVSQCTAVDYNGTVVTFNPTAPGTPTVIGSDPSGLNAVGCPSTGQCTAVDNGGGEVTFNPTSSSTLSPTVVDSTTFALLGLACPSLSQCTTIDAGTGSEVTFDPASPGPPITPTKIYNGYNVTGLACPSAAQCTATFNNQEVTFNPAAPPSTVPAAVTIDTQIVGAIACPSTSECVAVDNGRAVQGDPGNPASWTIEPIPGANSLFGVACSSVAQCVTIDTVGNGFLGLTPPVNVSVPSISGQAVLGQTLTETHGSWLGSPTGYAYQWQRCNGAGNACAAIAGATGQSYTLTAADVGATIRVQETARNVVGASVSVSSPQTALVTGVPVSLSPPSTSGPAVAGQRLTEVHGSWSNSPTGYVYQWQRCDSAGANCSPIAGAGGQTYVLTGWDVGHTLLVRETASNAAGAGAPASSKPTAVVIAAGAPRVTGFRVTNKVFVVGQARTPIFGTAASAKKHRRGTTFHYSLSDTATVRIVISRRLPGRRGRKSCFAPSKRLRHAKPCARIVLKGTLIRISHTGSNKVEFSGRIGSRTLRPGDYQATLTATDTTKRTSKPQTIYFMVVKR